MNNADITLISAAATEEGRDETEFFTVGSFTQDGDSYIIRYGENAEIGYESCFVTITIKGETVLIERSAPAPSLLTVEKGKKHHMVYGTPYGDFMMGINAFEVKNDMTSAGGKLYLRYSIDINSDFVSENEINLTVKVNQ